MQRLIWRLATALGLFLTLNVWAGGSGLNVVVVVNQNSTNSVQLGNYYMQQRHVPPQNLLRINYATTDPSGLYFEWTMADFNNSLLNPLLAMLSSRQLTNQIDYIVLSMDIPYRINNVVTNDDDYNSTTAALFYGYKTDPHNPNDCEITDGSTNLYAGSESIFRATPPISANSNSWLVTMLVSSNDLPTAEMQVEQGAISDGTFPGATVWLGKSDDQDRNVRFSEFDNTVFDTRLRGNFPVMRTNIALASFDGLIGGYQNGSYYFYCSPVPLFVPGSMADNLTSFGGKFLEDTTGQITLLRFLQAGAAGSYGTVLEPCNYLEKFPDSQKYFYQSRGFSLAECYYQSVTNPYQGLVAGEPLAAPYAQTGTGAWSGLASNAVLSGTPNLSVQFTASDAQHPLQSLDLFVDGTYFETVTNISPLSGNQLKVSLNGFATSFIVPSSPAQTVKSLASNLVTVLNGTTYKNNTKVLATAHGDRIELQSTAAFTKLGSQIPLSVSSTNTTGSLNTFIFAAAANPTNLLDTVANGLRTFQITSSTGTVLTGTTLTLSVTKTNNTTVTVIATNSTTGTPCGIFTQQFMTAINNTASLQGPDGLNAGDLDTNSDGSLAQFNLYANSPGFAAAQIKASVTSLLLMVAPSGSATLTDNVNDLEPRNHLYIASGVTNLNVTFPLVTASLTDGYHELAAVAYEGTSVHTQTRATQDVVVKNSPLSATLTPVLTGTNSALEPTLAIKVTANTNNITSIQLFSTGGLLASASGQSSATFSITLSNLNIGVHPFYAMVTDGAGHQFRTQTQTVGLIGVSYSNTNLFGVDLPFPLQITSRSPLLAWPATAGRAYNILSSTNLNGPFQFRLMVTPNSSLGQWMETNTAPAQQFYRVSVAP